MELDDDAVLNGSVVDVAAGTAAAVGTIVSAGWASAAWVVVGVLAVKTVVQAAVTAFGRNLK
jgi:hypothetical protein